MTSPLVLWAFVCSDFALCPFADRLPCMDHICVSSVHCRKLHVADAAILKNNVEATTHKREPGM
jgi:hypothetical protein